MRPRSGPSPSTLRSLWVVLLLCGAACLGPREPQGRGWAPAVLPAQATLRPAAEGRGGALVLLVETSRGVLLHVSGTRLAAGRHELVLAPDATRGWPLERLGVLEADAQGSGDLELELEGHTLAAGSRLLGRDAALIGPDSSVLRGVIEKGIEVQEPRTRESAPPRQRPAPPGASIPSSETRP